MQNNTNSGENTNGMFGQPCVSQFTTENPTLLGEILGNTEGIIKVKNMLNEVFTTFFLSENFCGRIEDSRLDYVSLYQDLNRWVDICHAEQDEAKAEANFEESLKALDAAREKVIEKRKNSRK